MIYRNFAQLVGVPIEVSSDKFDGDDLFFCWWGMVGDEKLLPSPLFSGDFEGK